MSLKIKLAVIAILFWQIALTNAQCGIRWRSRCRRSISKRAPPGLHYLDSEMATNDKFDDLKEFEPLKIYKQKIAFLKHICEDVLKRIDYNCSFEVCR